MGEKLRVGYARADITPEESVPLAGYGNTLTRMSQGALEPLMATCIAITDEKESTMLLFSLDIVSTRDAYCMQAREQICQKYGIPVPSIVIAATHTHSGPDMAQKDLPAIQRYADHLVSLLVETAGKALADRKSAVLRCGRTYNQGMNYVRHYIQENGSILGDNFGDPTTAQLRCHVSEADKEIRLVRFRREGGKDVLLVNWQAHPNLASTIATEYGRAHRPYLSADYVGACRSYVEEKADVHFVFFLGAAGNVNSRSRMDTEMDTRDHNCYGQQLGEYVLAGMKDLQPLKHGTVAASIETLTCRLNHTEDHLVPMAKEVRVEWAKSNDARKCMQIGQPYGIHSAYHAGAIIAKADMPTHTTMDLGAGRIGDLGLAFMPYEMFDTNGKYVREESPFGMTLVFSCANGGHAYIPSARGFEHGCYEADMCRFAPGTGEEAAQLAVSMLRTLHQEV